MPEAAHEAPTLVAAIAAALRRERSRAGLTLTELARQAGIAKSTLSQLESGVGNPSVETIWALGSALGIPFSRLIEPPRTTVTLVRAGEGPAAHSDQANYVATLLSTCPPHARRDLFRIQAEPGAPRLSEPHPPGTTEHVVLAGGRALVGPRESPVELQPGDYLSYPGDAAHVFEALEPATSAIIVMEFV